MLNSHNMALQNQMEIINQSTEAIRILKHDFKDHLIMLSHLYKSDKTEEIEPYINNLLGNTDNKSFANSNNFIIDSVVNFKLGSIKNNDINLSLSINVPIMVNILAYDLTVVLSNLLDNAITENGTLKTTKLYLYTSINKM